MDRNSFIESYRASFLGAVAAQRYLNNNDPKWKWVNTQPVEDATHMAEKAWDSLQVLVVPFTKEMTGNVATATTGTASTPITSSSPENAEPTPSTISSPSVGDATEPSTMGS